MDTEKLIERLNDFNENHIAVLCGSGQCACGYLCDKDDCIVVRAATALSTLQAENEKLRADLNDLKAQWDMYGGDEGITATFAELEQVKRERDAAIKDIWVPKWISCKNGENCSFVSAVTGMPDCAGCDNWEWRGQRKEN